MINGARMKKMDVGNWLADNSYGGYQINQSKHRQYAICYSEIDMLPIDNDGYVLSSDVYAVFQGCFPNGRTMYRDMICKVSQVITLERVN